MSLDENIISNQILHQVFSTKVYFISLLPMQHIRTILFLCLVHPFVSTSQNCLKTSLYFNSGKENLKKNQLLVLDSLLNSLNPDSTYLIELHGHTDDRGTEE